MVTLRTGKKAQTGYCRGPGLQFQEVGVGLVELSGVGLLVLFREYASFWEWASLGSVGLASEWPGMGLQPIVWVSAPFQVGGWVLLPSPFFYLIWVFAPSGSFCLLGLGGLFVCNWASAPSDWGLDSPPLPLSFIYILAFCPWEVLLLPQLWRLAFGIGARCYLPPLLLRLHCKSKWNTETLNLQ